MAVRHVDASGGDIMENQHEDKRKTSKSTQRDQKQQMKKEWRNTLRLEQEAPNSSASSDPYVALEHPVRSEIPSRPGSVRVQKSGHVDDDVQFSALDVFYENDGRGSRCIGEVLERYRGEDARDLK